MHVPQPGRCLLITLLLQYLCQITAVVYCVAGTSIPLQGRINHSGAPYQRKGTLRTSRTRSQDFLICGGALFPPKSLRPFLIGGGPLAAGAPSHGTTGTMDNPAMSPFVGAGKSPLVLPLPLFSLPFPFRFCTSFHFSSISLSLSAFPSPSLLQQLRVWVEPGGQNHIDAF